MPGLYRRAVDRRAVGGPEVGHGHHRVARRAQRGGATTIRLETNRTLTEAVKMYRSAGYREVAAFNSEPYAHHWFEKTQ